MLLRRPWELWRSGTRTHSKSSPPLSRLKSVADSGTGSLIRRMVVPWQVVPILPSLYGILKQVEWSKQSSARSPLMGWSFCGRRVERQSVLFRRGCRKPLLSIRTTLFQVQHGPLVHSSQEVNRTSGPTTHLFGSRQQRNGMMVGGSTSSKSGQLSPRSNHSLSGFTPTPDRSVPPLIEPPSQFPSLGTVTMILSFLYWTFAAQRSCCGKKTAVGTQPSLLMEPSSQLSLGTAL